MKSSCRSVWRVGRSWRAVCMTLPVRGYTYTHTPVARREADEGFLKRPRLGCAKRTAA